MVRIFLAGCKPWEELNGLPHLKANHCITAESAETWRDPKDSAEYHSWGNEEVYSQGILSRKVRPVLSVTTHLAVISQGHLT